MMDRGLLPRPPRPTSTCRPVGRRRPPTLTRLTIPAEAQKHLRLPTNFKSQSSNLKSLPVPTPPEPPRSSPVSWPPFEHSAAKRLPVRFCGHHFRTIVQIRVSISVQTAPISPRKPDVRLTPWKTANLSGNVRSCRPSRALKRELEGPHQVHRHLVSRHRHVGAIAAVLISHHDAEALAVFDVGVGPIHESERR